MLHLHYLYVLLSIKWPLRISQVEQEYTFWVESVRTR